LESGEELGFDGLTIEGVASRSGIAKPTIYWRLPDVGAIVCGRILGGRRVPRTDPNTRDCSRRLYGVDAPFGKVFENSFTSARTADLSSPLNACGVFVIAEIPDCPSRQSSHSKHRQSNSIHGQFS